MIGNNASACHTILTFQKFNLLQLPSITKDVYKINWKPVFSVIEECLNTNQYRSLPVSDFINVTYELGTNNIKKKESFGASTRNAQSYQSIEVKKISAICQKKSNITNTKLQTQESAV